MNEESTSSAATVKGFDFSLTNAGTITNTYGVYVGDITSGTQTSKPFSFYGADAEADNYFAGNVGIGTATPGAKLDVAGTVKIGGNLQLAVGTSTTAPVTLQSGALLTTPAAGSLEFDGGSLYLTNSGPTPTRRSLAYSASTLAGYGITDPVLLESGNYSNPTWIASLSAGKLTGTLPTASLPAFSGDATSSAGSSVLTLANSGATAGTYTKVTVDAKGRVTSGASLASGDITSALGFTPVNKAGDTMTGALAATTFTATGGTITGSATSGLSINASPTGNQNVTLNPSGTGYTLLNGNVGIGVATPSAKLEIEGTLKVSAAARFDGPVRIAPQGDLSMGEFVSEPQ